MQTHKYILAFFMMIIFSDIVFAQTNSKDTLYHCPYIQDIKFGKGKYYADTNYNGKSVSWADDSDFFPTQKPVGNFTHAKLICNGNSCNMQCNYKINSTENIITLEVLYGVVVTKLGDGNWDTSKNCVAVYPDQCKFYVSSHN